MTTFVATIKDFFCTIFKKKFLPRIFLKLSAKKVLCALGHIFNKVNRDIVEKPNADGAQNWPGR